MLVQSTGTFKDVISSICLVKASTVLEACAATADGEDAGKEGGVVESANGLAQTLEDLCIGGVDGAVYFSFGETRSPSLLMGEPSRFWLAKPGASLSKGDDTAGRLESWLTLVNGDLLGGSR